MLNIGMAHVSAHKTPCPGRVAKSHNHSCHSQTPLYKNDISETILDSLHIDDPAQVEHQKTNKIYLVPCNMVSTEELETLLATAHVYTPAAVTVRVCVYCAVSGSSNTVSVPSVTVVVESLVQVTLVAGPPVEMQVSVN